MAVADETANLSEMCSPRSTKRQTEEKVEALKKKVASNKRSRKKATPPGGAGGRKGSFPI